MKISLSLYILNTWLVTNLLHPVAILAWVMMSGHFPDRDVLAIMWIMSTWGLACSVPGLLVARIALWCVFHLRVPTPVLAFITWIFIGSICVVACGFVLMLFLGAFEIELLEFVLPAIVAFICAVLIRYQQFIRLFISWCQDLKSDNETQSY